MEKKPNRKAVVSLTLILILLISFVPFEKVAAKSGDLPVLQSSAYDLIAEVNALRIASGLPEYIVSPILMGTAQAQADFMASIGSVTHSGPGGISLTQRLLNAGYPLAGDLSLGGFRAENITGGAGKTATGAVQQWLGDAEHINTMLSPALVEIGAGVAISGGRVYYVIDCARPTTSGALQVPLGSAVAITNENSIAGTPGAEVIPQYMAPVLTVTPDTEGLVYHEVLYGQSLWSLAIAYGVKIDEIRALNGLAPEYVIQTGDRLIVRKDTPLLVTQTFIPSMSPVPLKVVVTATSFLTITVTTTQKTSPDSSETLKSKSPIAGIVVGIILVTLLFAGLATWISARKVV